MAKFRTALLDPPWPENGGGKCKRGADRHYRTVKVREMEGVIRSSGQWDPADDAHCYLWVTNNYLPAGLDLLRALGFRYVTTIAWVKIRPPVGRTLRHVVSLTIRGRFLEAVRSLVQHGLGQYFRGGHELLLFGVRGDGIGIRTERRDLGTVILAPRGAHSAKPPEAYALVEARSPGPYLEMFARAPRDGWTSWGDEVDP